MTGLQYDPFGPEGRGAAYHPPMGYSLYGLVDLILFCDALLFPAPPIKLSASNLTGGYSRAFYAILSAIRPGERITG